MNKKIPGIAILAVIVIGLIIVGRNVKRPAPVDTAQPLAPDANTASTAAAPVSKSPPKATAKPKTGVAAPQVTSENILLDLSSEFARTYKAKLEPFLKNPPDFYRYYVIAKWPCGDNCLLAAVIDKRNGKVYIAPPDQYGSKQPAPNFKFYTLNENLYRVVNKDVMETYSFDGSRFTLVNIENF